MTTPWGDFVTAALMWGCDDDCNCSEPRIAISGPNRIAGEPWWRHVIIWAGRFCSDASPREYREQLDELAAEAKVRNIPMRCETYGSRAPTKTELAEFEAAEQRHRERIIAEETKET